MSETLSRLQKAGHGTRLNPKHGRIFTEGGLIRGLHASAFQTLESEMSLRATLMEFDPYVQAAKILDAVRGAATCAGVV